MIPSMPFTGCRPLDLWWQATDSWQPPSNTAQPHLFYNMLVDGQPSEKAFVFLQFQQRSNGKQIPKGFRVVSDNVRDVLDRQWIYTMGPSHAARSRKHVTSPLAGVLATWPSFAKSHPQPNRSTQRTYTSKRFNPSAPNKKSRR